MSMWERSIPAPPPEVLQQLGDADSIKVFEELVMNVLASRQSFFQQFFDPRRDIYKECGYPAMGADTVTDHYQALYEREAIPARVVEVLPEQTWQIQPTVYEDEDPEVSTPFEKGWDETVVALAASMGRSYFQTERGSAIWEYLRRVDVLSGIGQFGIMLLGLNDLKDGKTADQPVTPSPDNKLLFIRCFPERLAYVSRFDDDEMSPRYGQPIEYNVTFLDPRSEGTAGGLGATGTNSVTGTGSARMTSRNVHWTRVIHIADNLSSSEVFGMPRMRPVLNRLLDLQKLYGGSAEMYWRGAFPGISFETHPSLGAEAVKINKEGVRSEMENYMQGLQRYIALQGLTAKSLAPQVVDPTPQIQAQIDAICIKLGIPKRIFMGSERGELASGQDDATWNDRLRERQRNYVTPRMIVPLVDRLIHLGVLPEPKGFSVWWPDLTSQTSQEKSQIAFQRTQAIAQFVGSNSQSMITPLDYLVTILGLDEDEAVSIIENVRQQKLRQNIPPTPDEGGNQVTQ